MKFKDMKGKTDEALKADLAERRKHLFDLRSQAVTEKLEDPTQLGKTKQTIARLKTAIRQRQLEKTPKPVRPSRQDRVAARAAAKKKAKLSRGKVLAK